MADNKWPVRIRQSSPVNLFVKYQLWDSIGVNIELHRHAAEKQKQRHKRAHFRKSKPIVSKVIQKQRDKQHDQPWDLQQHTVNECRTISQDWHHSCSLVRRMDIEVPGSAESTVRSKCRWGKTLRQVKASVNYINSKLRHQLSWSFLGRLRQPATGSEAYGYGSTNESNQQ